MVAERPVTRKAILTGIAIYLVGAIGGTVLHEYSHSLGDQNATPTWRFPATHAAWTTDNPGMEPSGEIHIYWRTTLLNFASLGVYGLGQNQDTVGGAYFPASQSGEHDDAILMMPFATSGVLLVIALANFLVNNRLEAWIFHVTMGLNFLLNAHHVQDMTQNVYAYQGFLVFVITITGLPIITDTINQIRKLRPQAA